MSKFQGYLHGIINKAKDISTLVPVTVNEKVLNLLDYQNITLEDFAIGTTKTNQLDEMEAFATFTDLGVRHKKSILEFHRQGKQLGRFSILRKDKQTFDVTSFSVYNYLGLANDPRVIEASKAALDQYGMGAGASPILGGNLAIHEALEEALVQFFGLPDRKVSLFSNGYAVNVGTITAFLKKGHVAVLDSFAHISLIEGAKTSGAQVMFFEHNNMEQLEKILLSLQDKGVRTLICTEGVYSAEGDFGKLPEIVALAKKYGAYTLVDEAHSILVTGNKGRGVASQLGVLDQVDLIILTMSKAFGGIGGAVLAKRSVANYINYYARSRMFSCAMAPAIAGGMLKSLDIAASEEGDMLRAKVAHNAAFLRNQLEGHCDLCDSKSWIIPVMFYSEKINVDLMQFLHEEGLDCGTMLFPAAPKGSARLRLFVTAYHTEEDLEKAAKTILKASEKFKFGSLK